MIHDFFFKWDQRYKLPSKYRAVIYTTDNRFKTHHTAESNTLQEYVKPVMDNDRGFLELNLL